MLEKVKKTFTKKKNLIIIGTVLIVFIIILAIIFSTKEKILYREVPYELADFENYPSNITIKMPKNDTWIGQNISSMEMSQDTVTAVRVIIFDYSESWGGIGMKVIVYGSYNRTNGILAESIKSLKILLESHDSRAIGGFLDTTMQLYNLRNESLYYSHSDGLSYWRTEGAEYNEVCMESSVLWSYDEKSTKDFDFRITAKLTVGNLFSSHEIATSVQILLTV